MIKKKLLYYFAVGLMFMCVSCGWFEEDQMGYPRTVTVHVCLLRLV